eukprot:scaffold62365_cov44-Cyclotella_meneghiniana.AAC.6
MKLYRNTLVSHLMLSTSYCSALNLRHTERKLFSVEVKEEEDALSLAKAAVVESDPFHTFVVGAEIETSPPNGTTTGTVLYSGMEDLAGISSGIVISTGEAKVLELTENNSSMTGEDMGGCNVRGDLVFDVTVLRIDLDIPVDQNCLSGDFMFLSEEFPEFVDSDFNDAFILELDESTWTTSENSTIYAPDNIAIDEAGDIVSVRTTGVTSMSATEQTEFDGSTPWLRFFTPVTPGHHSLYVSVFDQGDPVYDSAVVLGNIHSGEATEGNCEIGLELQPTTTTATTEIPSTKSGKSTKASKTAKSNKSGKSEPTLSPTKATNAAPSDSSGLVPTST